MSTAHDQKARFVTSSDVTSQKWNLRIQIGQVLQFYVHCISAKYHSFKLHTYEEETFRCFDFFNWPLESHVTGNHRNDIQNIPGIKYCCLYKFQLHAFKKKSYSPKNSKNYFANHAPTESFACLA